MVKVVLDFCLTLLGGFGREAVDNKNRNVHHNIHHANGGKAKQ